MKILLPAALVAASLCAYSCKESKQVTPVSAAFSTDSTEFVDSVVESGYTSPVALHVTYPTAGSPAADSINAWIANALGTPYLLRNSDTKAMVHSVGLAYVDTVRSALAAEKDAGMTPPAPQAYIFQVGPDYVTDKFATYTSVAYVDLGGAHGGTSFRAAVFEFPGGKTLGYDIFKTDSMAAVRTLVLDALKSQYFKVSTTEELAEHLLVAPENVTLPEQAPYFMKNGVGFVYQQYEIAPYSEGMPSCTISYDALRPYFSDKAAELLR